MGGSFRNAHADTSLDRLSYLLDCVLNTNILVLLSGVILFLNSR